MGVWEPTYSVVVLVAKKVRENFIIIYTEAA